LDEVYNNLKIEDKTDNQEYVINRNLVKNSSNKFTYEMEMFSTHQGDKIDVTKSQLYKFVNGALLSEATNEEVQTVDLDEVYKNLKIKGNTDTQEYVINRNLVKNSSNKFTF